MDINKIIRMDEWNLKQFLIVMISIQLMMWGLIGLDLLNYHIPVIRQLIGFIYLTFIPGIIFVRILKLRTTGAIDVLLYSVGSSIAVTMFAGALINFIYTIFNVPEPISLTSLTAMLSIIILAMCFICYKVDAPICDYIGKNVNADLKDIQAIPLIALSIIPIICIVGAYLVNFYNSNLLLMLLIIMISLVIFLMIIKSKSVSTLYPLVIFIISFSLLFHNSLISMYITGWDIHLEYYLANLVLINNSWNPNFFSSVNSMLSIVMLAPIYSIMLNLDLTWVFKIVYPLIFSLVPVGLYQVFQKQTGKVTAFLACIFFMSLFTFYTEMLALARQQIAELFFVLLILLIISKEMKFKNRVILVTVFSVSLIVSHYGLSYIYIFFILVVWLLGTLKRGLPSHFDILKFNRNTADERDSIINIFYVILLIAFTLIWYTYTSQSSNLTNFASICSTIINNTFTDLLNPALANPASVQGLDIILSKKLTFMHIMAKYLHLLCQAFIILGLIVTAIKVNKTKFNSQFLIMSFNGLLFCILGIILPYFSSSLNTTRLYQITLMVLAPFCIIGLTCTATYIGKVINTLKYINVNLMVSIVLSIFIITYLLLNSGFIYELLDDSPTSISLSQESIQKYGDLEDKSATLYNAINTFDQDIYSINWYKRVTNSAYQKLYTDLNTRHPCISYGMMADSNIISENVNSTPSGSYLLFGYPSVKENVVRTGETAINMTDILGYLLNDNKIYDNGGSEICFTL